MKKWASSSVINLENLLRFSKSIAPNFDRAVGSLRKEEEYYPLRYHVASWARIVVSVVLDTILTIPHFDPSLNSH